MATEGLQPSATTSSPAYYCDRCQEGDKHVVAICYCPECQRGFCGSCKALHEDFTTNHATLEADRRSEWGQQAAAALKTVAGATCPDHRGEAITLFCGQHDALCCASCDSLGHGNCQNKAYIPDIAQGTSDSKELDNTIVRVKKMLLKLKKMKDTKGKQRTGLADSRERFQNTVVDIQMKVNSTLDTLVTEAEKNVDELRVKRQGQIEDKINMCDNLVQELCKLEEQIRACIDTTDNDCRMFILLKKGQDLVLDCKEFLNSASQSVNYDIDYTVDKMILESLSNETPLVDLQQDTETRVPVTSLRQITEYKVKANEDKSTCYIQGICQLLDGTIIMSDNSNRNLKRIDKSYSVTEVHPLKDNPKGLCCSGHKEVAVALGDVKKIQLVCVTDKIRLAKCLDFDHACYNLACDKDTLYVTGKKETLYAYTIDRCSQYVSGCTARFKIEHSGLTDIALSKTGNLLYMVDLSNTLTIYNTSDDTKSVVLHKSLTKKTEKGVFVDTRGNVLVCSQTTGASCIVQFSNLGREATPLSVENTKGVDYPGLIFVDASQPKVIVQRNNYFWGSDTVCIGELGYD